MSRHGLAIRDLVARTGVEQGTLRMWERRHGFPVPERLASGHRRYSERDEDRSAVRDALRKLPESQREALVLAYWGGLTAEEIAQRVGVPLGTAKSRIRLGLSRARTHLGEAA